MGNRQLANGNTDDLFRNRHAIIKAAPAASQVQENLKQALANATKLEYLDHRSKLNERVLKISQELSEINTKCVGASRGARPPPPRNSRARTRLIAVNKDIIDTNEEIVEFNAAQIAKNSQLLHNGIGLDRASPQSNAALIASNTKKAEEIKERAAANKKLTSELYDATSANRGRLLANTELIAKRRSEILANHSKIAANQALVAQLISKN